MTPYRNILFAVLALLGVVCLCLTALGVAAVGVVLIAPTSGARSPETPPPTPQPTPVGQSGAGAQQPLSRQMEQIQSQGIQLQGQRTLWVMSPNLKSETDQAVETRWMLF